MNGTGVALITPFKQDQSIDLVSLKKMVDHVIDGGVDYIVVLGTTGETATLNQEEKNLIYRSVVDYNEARVQLVAGIGGNNTAEVVEVLNSFDYTGYSAVLSVSPYYNKPNQQGIYMHYAALAAVSKLPIILYNVPGRTGSTIAMETVCRLAENHQNIIAVKEASGNFELCMNIIQNKPQSFMVTSGDDAITLPFMSIGMCGVISVIANAFPKKFSQMVKLLMAKDYEAAKSIHYELYDLMKLIFADGSPGGIKYILSKLDLCEEVVRLPLFNISEATARQIDAALSKINA